MAGAQIRQIAGVDAVLRAFDEEIELTLLLVSHECPPGPLEALLERAAKRAVPVQRGTPNDLRRMSAVQPPAHALALVGRRPKANLDEVLADGGVIWLMAGCAFPRNIGPTIRAAEVSGATAICIDGELDSTLRKESLRFSMGAHRFMPVLWEPAAAFLAAARGVGYRVVGIEDVGVSLPWEVDLTGRVVLVVGGEREGIPAEVLAACDEVVRLPMAGFIPSYNLQGAIAVVAVERLRQLAR